MGDSENAQQPSKKRGALNQLSRENPGLDDDEVSAELESGTFKKASDEVLASRRIVKIKRKEPSAAPVTAPNPFAGIQLVPATIAPAPTAVGTNTTLTPAEAVVEGDQKAIDNEEDDEVDSTKVDVKVKDAAEEETKNEDDNQCVKTSEEKVTDSDVNQTVSGVANISNAVVGTDQTEEKDQTQIKEKEGGENEETDNNGALSSFQQHSSSKNAFTGLASTEASGPPLTFGSSGTGSSFGFGFPNSNNSSLVVSPIIKKSEGSGFPPKQEVSTETGEENEKVAFSADSVMFEYLDGGWKERGKGEVKVNVSSNGGKARLVMRAKGNYRLILNASLYPEMKLASMDKKGITFACMNSVSEGKEGLSTFALKFKDPTIVEEFRVAIDKHKDSKPTEAAPPLKTPENSPTAADA